MTNRGGWTLCAAGAAGLFAQHLFAQQGSIGGPVAGYVFDRPSQVLRVIHGIPGASLIGEGVEFGSGITNAWVAPKLDSALVVKGDGTAGLFRLDGGRATLRSMDGLLAPERAIFSPSGTAMALVTAASVRIIRGLPDAPVVAGTVDLPQERVAFTGSFTTAKRSRIGGPAMAVSDDGAYLLLASGGAIELLATAGNSRKLTDAGAGSLPAFAPGGHDAAVVNAQEVMLFQDASGAATVRRLPGIGAAKAVAFSPDGRRLFVASASVMSVDVATGERSEIACGCRPSELVRMGNAFRLNELGTEPLWLLDASADPRVVFVPARSGM